MSAASQTDTAEQELTDGFNLVIDALKLNGIKTIYNVPGIPITDLGRMAQAAGIRVLSFRHEQNAGYAASIAGFLTKQPGVCLTVSAPGFLNGLTALAHATTNCFPMILISGSSEREIVDLQQGDYEEMDQLAIAKPLCKAAFRVLHAADIGIGLARAIRAACSGRPGGVYLDLPAKLFGQVMGAEAGKKSLVKVIDPAPEQIPAPAAVKRALDVLKGAKKPLIILGKGAAYAQADDVVKSFVEKSGIPFLPMSMAKGLLPDTHPQCAGAARSTVLKDSDVVMLVGARLNRWGDPIDFTNPAAVTFWQQQLAAYSLLGIEGYKLQFERVFPGEGITIDNVAKAIASFERALVTGPSPWDYYESFKTFSDANKEDLADLEALKKDDPAVYEKYEALKKATDEHPISDSAKRGGEIFFGLARGLAVQAELADGAGAAAL